MDAPKLRPVRGKPVSWPMIYMSDLRTRIVVLLRL